MHKIINFILRYRGITLALIILLTAFFSYRGLRVPMSYEYAQLLPPSDSESIVYQQFKKQFEEDGAVFFIGFKDSNIKKVKNLKAFLNLTNEIKKVEGVKGVLSFHDIRLLKKDTIQKKFSLVKLFTDSNLTQQKVDSLFQVLHGTIFYRDFLFTQQDAYALLIYIDNNYLNSARRNILLNKIHEITQEFSNKTGIQCHYSGMPYIRTMITDLAKIDIKRFTLWALILVFVLLLLFFRSLRISVISLILVLIAIAWSLGIMDILGFKITILSGVLPVIIVLISIENTVYLITRYHQEIVRHQNQALALVNIIKKTGLALFLANLTTAIGFGSFMVAPSNLFKEFGLVAFLSILFIFLLTLFLIPILFSYFPIPKDRHLKHLSFSLKILSEKTILHSIEHKKRLIYAIAAVFGIAGIIGFFLIQNRSSMIDDIPRGHNMISDLKFFEDNFKGVLPFEITIDTKKKKGIFSLSTLQRVDSLQNFAKKYDDVISRPLSVVDVIKYARQTFYGGDSSMYDLPNEHDKGFILSYMTSLKKKDEKNNFLKTFVDTNYQIIRVNFRLKNVSTPEIKRIKNDFLSEMQKLFPAQKYEYHITGAPVVFEKGTRYLLDNLIYSVILTIVIITLLMFILFKDGRLILIIMVANVLPLLVTAGMMGYLNVPLKPSTIIVFSISLGISIDSAIQLLSRFRQELRSHRYGMKTSLLNAVKETLPGMIYSGIVLILGFFIFIFSLFGGTQVLGYLVTATLFFAILSNMFLLPSLILSYEKYISRKAIEEAKIELDEE